jgi:hypothetical protein
LIFRLLSSGTRLFEKACLAISHRWHQQAAVEKQIPHFATRFSNEQASVTSSAVCCSIAASVVWFVIGANWIVRTNP